MCNLRTRQVYTVRCVHCALTSTGNRIDTEYVASAAKNLFLFCSQQKKKLYLFFLFSFLSFCMTRLLIATVSSEWRHNSAQNIMERIANELKRKKKRQKKYGFCTIIAASSLHWLGRRAKQFKWTTSSATRERTKRWNVQIEYTSGIIISLCYANVDRWTTHEECLRKIDKKNRQKSTKLFVCLHILRGINRWPFNWMNNNKEKENVA